MSSLNATTARKTFFDMVKNAVLKHEIFHINYKKGGVVLMSEDDYESLQETIHLLSIPKFRESMVKSLKQMNQGQVYTMDEVFGPE